MRVEALLLGLLLLLPVSSAWSAPEGGSAGAKSELLERLGSKSSFTASFVETKQLKMLRSALVTKGELRFDAKQGLLRIVTSPRPSRTLVDSEAIRSSAANGSIETIPLDARPELRALVGGLLLLLSGQSEQLQRDFEVRVESSAKHWSVKLEPKRPELKRLLRALEFQGRGDRVESYALVDASGDRTHTTIADFTPTEFEPGAFEAALGSQ